MKKILLSVALVMGLGVYANAQEQTEVATETVSTVVENTENVQKADNQETPVKATEGSEATDNTKKEVTTNQEG